MTFNSGQWKRGYNPDLAMVSNRIRDMCNRTVLPPIPHSQHRPRGLVIKPAITPIEQPFRRRFNLQKAKWDDFTEDLDVKINTLGPPIWQNYDSFVNLVLKTARKHIPRGCRMSYIPGLTPDASKLLDEYQRLYEEDPFSEDTIQAGLELNDLIKSEQQKQWEEMAESINLTHNSKRGWQKLSKLKGEPKPATSYNVTPDAVAHQLLLIGKPDPNRNFRIYKPQLEPQNDDETILTKFTMSELINATKLLCNGKAPGLDGIHNEMPANTINVEKIKGRRSAKTGERP